MNEFVPRIDAVAPERHIATRPAPAAPLVAPTAAAAHTAQDSGVQSDHGEQARREQMASAFDYARVQARVADILSDLAGSSQPPPEARVSAEGQLDALRPVPTVIIPMLPASVEVVERAVDVARAMAQQAELARAAQAHVNVGTVDQILAA
ncbi:MAG: hypothetical protein LKF30_00280 [Sphingobium sp.]|jgi:hypothetical protein|nr:hypothetical protein [Sphingobium sp.]MCI1270107.1 hypothetical protein [Sphingobium sp.]MCI1754966.1 hypothetical protein [Sphingobium sp.]MCI2051711.1 hypothetical protein [Sphingobium sp.]